MNTFGLRQAAALALSMASVGVAQAADPVRIGFMMPTQTWTGQQAVKGAEIAAQLINEAGGILNGRLVEVVTYDDAQSPIEGAAAAQRLIDEDGIRIFAGQFSSSVALAVIPVAQAENALYMAALAKSSAINESGYEGVLHLNTTGDLDADAMKVVFESTGADKVAYVGENSDFGRQFLDVVKSIQADLGAGSVVSSGFYDVKQSDFSGLVTDAKASGADTLVVMGGVVEQYANVLRATAELGYDPENVILGPGILNRQVIELAGDSAEGAMSVDIYLARFENELNQTFVTKFEAANGSQPEKIEELGFEAIWLLAKAIEEAGGTDDPLKVAEVLRSKSWDTPRGAVSFRDDGQALGDAVPLVVRDGEIHELN